VNLIIVYNHHYRSEVIESIIIFCFKNHSLTTSVASEWVAERKWTHSTASKPSNHDSTKSNLTFVLDFSFQLHKADVAQTYIQSSIQQSMIMLFTLFTRFARQSCTTILSKKSGLWLWLLFNTLPCYITSIWLAGINSKIFLQSYREQQPMQCRVQYTPKHEQF